MFSARRALSPRHPHCSAASAVSAPLIRTSETRAQSLSVLLLLLWSSVYFSNRIVTDLAHQTRREGGTDRQERGKISAHVSQEEKWGDVMMIERKEETNGGKEEGYCSSCGSNLSISRDSEWSFVNKRLECECCQSHDDDVSGAQSESTQVKIRNNSSGKWMTEKRQKCMR